MVVAMETLGRLYHLSLFISFFVVRVDLAGKLFSGDMISLERLFSDLCLPHEVNRTPTVLVEESLSNMFQPWRR